MSQEIETKARRYLASVALVEAYTDFTLSRQAIRCCAATVQFYRYTEGGFLSQLQARGVMSPPENIARHVREYFAELVGAGKSDTTVHDHARAIKTLLRFWHEEGYLPAPVVFAMPRLQKKRLPVLTAEELRELLSSRPSPRHLALIKLMGDSGPRRAEVCAPDWEDVDFASGLVRVRRGKGRNSWTAVIGVTAPRALLAYRRKVLGFSSHVPVAETAAGPLFLSKRHARMTRPGMDLLFRRLSKRSGIHVTPHAAPDVRRAVSPRGHDPDTPAGPKRVVRARDGHALCPA